MGLLGIFFLLASIMFISALSHIRDTLVIFSVCSLLSVILLWGLASVYVTAAVAMADFCHEPTPYVKRVMESSFNLSKDFTNYYLKCNEEETNSSQILVEVWIFSSFRFIFSTFSSKDAVLVLEEIQKKWKERVDFLSNRQHKANERDKSNQWDLQEAAKNALKVTLDLMTILQCDSIFTY